MESGFEPYLTWSQPHQTRPRTRLSAAELAHIGEIIISRELELEPTTIRGILRTVSEISAWQLEIEDGEIVEIEDGKIVEIDAKKMPTANTATLRTGMSVSVDVAVTEETGPAGKVKPKHTPR